jgi:hypothetical protein
MKILFVALAFIATSAISTADEDREVTSKTLELKFETIADAYKWSVRELGFKEWIEAVAVPGWIELHKSETEDFYFAIFRKDQHLMFCQNDRKDAYRLATTSVRAVDDKVAYDVWEKPSLWTTLKHNISFPSGSYSGQQIYAAWKIKDGFSGEMIMKYSVKNDGTPNREVLRQTVTWKQ